MVTETKSAIAELLAKDPVLLAKIVNDLAVGVDSSNRKRRSAESGTGRKLFGVSKPIIAGTELWWNHSRFIQIQFPDHSGKPRGHMVSPGVGAREAHKLKPLGTGG
jgi:hypothetical protein